MTDTLSMIRASLAIARARQRREGLDHVYPKIHPTEKTVIVGDTTGRFSSSYHWDEQIRAAHKLQGVSQHPCAPRHIPTEPVDHFIVTSDALANQSTPEELSQWMSQLAEKSAKLTLLSMIPGPDSLTLDEEDHSEVLLGDARVSITIRRDFYRQLEWEWIRVEQAQEPIKWATCRRWFYPQELETLLTGIGQPHFKWREQASSGQFTLGVIETKVT